MKKNLLIAALVIPLLSVSAQWTQTGGTVSVKPNTLHYMSGSYEVNGGAKVINEGNVNVQGDFTVDDANTNAEFENVWTARNEYGQLIIKNGTTVTGKIKSEYNLPGDMDFISIAFPFQNYQAGDLASDLGITPNYYGYTGSNSNFDPQRYTSSFWTWNNSAGGSAFDFYFKTLDNNSEVFDAYAYQGINNMNESISGTKTFNGTPYAYDWTLNIQPYTVGNSDDENIVGEQYGSYIEDVAVPKPNNWGVGQQGTNPDGYGNNISLFGNPYTSNIKLNGADGNITLASEISHIFYISDNTYTQQNAPNGWQGATAGLVATSFSGGQPVVGDAANNPEALVIRPHQTFFVKTVDGTSASTLDLNDAIKTFNKKTILNDISISRTNQDNGFYQATLHVYQDDFNTNQRVHVFASDVIQPTEQNRFEVYNTSIGNQLGIYSLQETAEGTVYSELADQKVYINGVNATDYVAKPISIGFIGNGEFTIKPQLTSNLENSGNKFYFEDKEFGEIFKVTSDFEYTFTHNGNTEDRFAMYWNGMPETLSIDNATLASKTIVFKDNKEFKVRFADTWNTADVYVYNALGQLVHAAKKIDASMDYVLPLRKNAAAYIVKAVSETGEVSTKKIITK